MNEIHFMLGIVIALQGWILRKFHELDKRLTVLEYEKKEQKQKDNILRLDRGSGGGPGRNLTDTAGSHTA